MKIFKLLPRLIAVFGLTMMFSVLGWGAAFTCSTSSTVDKTFISAENYNVSGATGSSKNMYYHFSVPSNGTLSLSELSGAALYYSQSACPTNASSSLASNGQINVTNGNLYLYVRTGSANANFSFTLTFASSVSALDLNITKTASVSSVTVGTDYTYTIKVGNQGTASAANLTIVDTLPSGATYKSFSGTGWTCSGTTTLSCTYGTLENGARASDLVLTVTAPATVPTPATIAVNRAAVSTTGESNTANNTAISGTVIVTVNAASGGVTPPLLANAVFFQVF